MLNISIKQHSNCLLEALAELPFACFLILFGCGKLLLRASLNIHLFSQDLMVASEEVGSQIQNINRFVSDAAGPLNTS